MDGGRSSPTGNAPDAAVLLVDFDGGTDGHRAQYNAMLAHLFRVRVAPFTPATTVARQPILVPQIEHSPVGFLILCLARAALGRRTVGLLLRPLPALHGATMRLRLKRLVLRLLRHLPGARVLTIVPFDIEPDFAKIAHGWIHDLQNWDGALGTATDPAATEQLSLAIRKAAGERLVCCAIGGQNRHKGFDRFAAIYADNPDLRARMLFAYGGKVAAPLGAASERFEQVGGFALNRFISDAELTAFYHAADIIWCVYDPAYDQASGLLGRAMQFGIPVAVRSGSVIERICRMEGHPHLALASIDDWDGLLSPPPAMPLGEAVDRARRHGQASLAKLAEALGVKPANDPFASPPQVP